MVFCLTATLNVFVGTFTKLFTWEEMRITCDQINIVKGLWLALKRAVYRRAVSHI